MKKIVASIVFSILLAVAFFSIQGSPGTSSNLTQSNLALITPTSPSPPPVKPTTPPSPPGEEEEVKKALPSTGEAEDLWAKVMDQVAAIRPTLAAPAALRPIFAPENADRTGSTDLSPILRISIPALSVDARVEAIPFDGKTWDISGLTLNVGWMNNTSEPGQGGNTVLVGHLNLKAFGLGPFKTLYRIPAQAEILLYTSDYVYTYKVRETKTTQPDDGSVIAPTSNPQLTLITCADWDEKTQEYLKRLVVMADLVKVTPLGK